MVSACHIIISKKHDREERVLGGWEKGWGRKETGIERRGGEERRMKKESEEEKDKKKAEKGKRVNKKIFFPDLYNTDLRRSSPPFQKRYLKRG